MADFLLTERAALIHSHIRPLRCSRKLDSLIVSIFAHGNLLGCNIADRAAPIDGYRIVERVIDADTLAMENGERTRLSGIDTPETKESQSQNSTKANLYHSKN